MRKILNKILKNFNYEIKKIQPEIRVVLENVFQTNFEKTVLISYIKSPFLSGVKKGHTSYLECYTSAEIFRELGYNVDVVEYNELNLHQVSFEKYDVIYGLGSALEKSFYSKNTEKIIKIAYGTGCSTYYSDIKSALKVKKFYEKTGVLISNSARITFLPSPLQYIASDKIISLGNDFTKSTYEIEGENLSIEKLNCFYYDVYNIDLSKKDFDKARKHYLWFGSTGLLHKGLDIVIEAFKQRPDLTLHVCGASENEEKFYEYYKEELNNQVPNIINHGFVNLESDEFKDVMNTCFALIYPSESEGGSPAALNVMANGGLIPVVSKQSGIDIDEFGFYFNENTVGGVIEQLEMLDKLDVNSIIELSCKTKDIVRKDYSYKNYKKSLKEIIKSTIESKVKN